MKAGTLPYTDATDEELYIRISRHNDDKAFACLYHRYGKLVYAYCQRVLGRKDEAADALQSIFLQMIEKKDLFTGGSLRAWLFTLARNRCLNDLAKRKVRQSYSLPLSDIMMDGIIDDVTPETLIEAKESDGAFIEAIAMLPAQLRQVIEYKYIDDKSYEEISDQLGISLNLVRVRVFRAKKLLCDYLLSQQDSHSND